MGEAFEPMKYTIVAVGKMRPPYVDDAEHYAKLLRGHARVDVVELKEDADVARRLPDRAHVVLLDVGGPHVRLARLRPLAGGPAPGRPRRLLRDRRRLRARAARGATSGSPSGR